MQCGFFCVIYRYYSVMGLYTGGLIFGGGGVRGGAYIRNGVNISHLMGFSGGAGGYIRKFTVSSQNHQEV